MSNGHPSERDWVTPAASGLPQRVEVEWLDILSDPTWTARETVLAEEPTRCFTVGYLLHGDERKIVLAHRINSDDDESDYTIIPRGCVVAVRKLTLAGE